jgi:hypothetical protein
LQADCELGGSKVPWLLVEVSTIRAAVAMSTMMLAQASEPHATQVRREREREM